MNPYANGRANYHRLPEQLQDQLPEPEPYVGAQRVQGQLLTVPEHEELSARSRSSSVSGQTAQVPWDANALQETALIDRSSSGITSTTAGYGGGMPQRTPTRGSSFRRYFDPEAGMRRAQSIRQLFTSNPEEFADDDEYSPVDIAGDEYELNTWEHQPVDQWGQHPREWEAPSGDLGGDYISEYPASPQLNAAAPEGEGDSGVRSVELFHGNLVLDCPVSPLLLKQYPEHRPVREFTHMRYTAATCDPSDFVAEEYTLRQMCYAQPRETELFVCVTIYNEDDVLLGRTLQGVFNNIRHLCHRSRSSTWGNEAWKKVVVCVVADGREKLNPRAKALMAALGAYQEGFAKNMVNSKGVEAHIYEYTTLVRIAGVSDRGGVRLSTEGATPVQLIFCMKEKNKKKINSHRWFFQAFGELLQPRVCVLLDAGTRPGNHAIYHLWKTFERDPHVAGACGEIAAMLGPGAYKLINPLVAAQNFEYKMSNILDKPTESVFGFITVLPGAFSAYRYEALQNGSDGKGPLQKYYRGETLDGRGGVFEANMYLAEDRILCWELVAKRGAQWVLRYVKSAKAHTDVPEQFAELVLQRRRWLNGSFFAQVYSLAHAFQIWRSGHPVWRKLTFHIQFLYQLISLTFAWFSLANFFLVFRILSEAVGNKSAHFAPGRILAVVLTWVYAACILVVFILSFGNRPQGTKKVYDMIVVFFALMMCYMVFCAVYISVKGIQYAICANGHHFQPKLLVTNAAFRDLIISGMATYGLYLLCSLLFFDPWHVFTSLVQYTVLSPAYVNVMNVYAFCNTHDISWGTKGDTAQRFDLGVVRADESGRLELELPTSTELVDQYYLNEIELLTTKPETEKSPPSEADKRKDYYALFRSSVVVVWVLMNLALIGVVLNVGGFQDLLGSNPGGPPTSSQTPPAQGAQPQSAQIPVFRARADPGVCEAIVAGGSTVSKVYMAVIFWSVAGFAAFRFVLSTVYLIQYMFRKI